MSFPHRLHKPLSAWRASVAATSSARSPAAMAAAAERCTPDIVPRGCDRNPGRLRTIAPELAAQVGLFDRVTPPVREGGRGLRDGGEVGQQLVAEGFVSR